MHELGRGQFGRVWLARWRGVEVAVKEPRRSGCARARRETLAEAAMLASLRHPCVTALFGILQDNVSTFSATASPKTLPDRACQVAPF